MAGTITKDFLNEQITKYLSENPDTVSKLLDAAGKFKENEQQTAGSAAGIGSLTDLSQNAAGNQTTQEGTAVPSYHYDADNDTVYQQALQNQQQVQAQAPVYGATYDQQIKDMYDQIMNQKPFEYDLNGDALWQQYKDQYTTQGKLAMMDTMGQAAALTGGYGSSYAQSVGQQAYQGYLQQLNDRVPELYQLALSKYNNDQAALKDQFSVTAQMQADEYGKYQDAVSQHNLALDRAQSAVDTAYDRGYNAWATEEQLRRQDEETSYNRQQSEYDKLANLIASTGYSPSEEELTAAGMTGTQATAYAKVYKDSKKTSTRSSGSKSSGSNSSTTKVTIPSEIKNEVEKRNTDGKVEEYVSKLEKDGTISQAQADYIRSVYIVGFKGTTYEEAKEYLADYGISGYPMTNREWTQHKNKNNSAGGEHEADTYAQYLQAYVMSKIG